MSMTLPDGTVIPSYLGADTMGQRMGLNAFSNVVLRQGEVREIIYPDDDRSVSKKVVEYSVVVQVRDGSGPAVSVAYPNCTVANLFGGVADVGRYTLRAWTKEPEKGKTTSDGSKVLLLCVNGELRRALIISGTNDSPEDPEKKDDGHNLFFEFNGIIGQINKDGELEVHHRGPTDNADKLKSGSEDKDDDASGSKVIFNKEGGIKVLTKDEKQFIFLDHKNKKIDVLADEEWHVKVNKKISIEAGDQITIDGDKGMDVTTQNDITMKSSGVKVGDATDAWMLGSTYRKAESQAMKSVSQQLSTASQQLQQASQMMLTAATGLKIPLYGGVVASTPVQMAGQAIGQAGSALSQAASAIDSFESSADTYLSKKNKND